MEALCEGFDDGSIGERGQFRLFHEVGGDLTDEWPGLVFGRDAVFKERIGEGRRLGAVPLTIGVDRAPGVRSHSAVDDAGRKASAIERDLDGESCLPGVLRWRGLSRQREKRE